MSAPAPRRLAARCHAAEPLMAELTDNAHPQDDYWKRQKRAHSEKQATARASTTTTRESRPLQPSTTAASTSGSGGNANSNAQGTWEVDLDGQWTPYSAPEQKIMNEAFRTGQNVVAIRIGSHSYKVNIHSLEQVLTNIRLPLNRAVNHKPLRCSVAVSCFAPDEPEHGDGTSGEL